ncbi:hypothetical protein D9Q98_010304 [Chlorella vulgaris]|uniref:Uncharacterized protein n=1 Tax=Chlorella vulgaris TaxID=3077 RepID=A0A9D4TJX5_CHLVU|nr:hypothetical protein D9Q98_010304 [Chlorella vulgaris]
MRPFARFGRATARAGVDQPPRTSAKADVVKARPSQAVCGAGPQILELSHRAAADGLPSIHQAPPTTAGRVALAQLTGSTAAATAAPTAPHGSCLLAGPAALLDAGRLLGRVLDELAHALTRHLAVPSHVEGLLAALFPAAAAISTTLPSADGQGLAVTPLLQPAAGCQLRYYSQQQQWYRHAEPLGQGGLCTFQLAVPPSGTVLQLIHAFVAELAGRLKLESASISAVVGLQRKVPLSQSPPHTPRTALSAPSSSFRPASCSASASAFGSMQSCLDQAPAMPADCFWMSV